MLRLRIGETLRSRGITRYRLWKASGLAKNTVYSLSGTSERVQIDLPKLNRAIRAIEQLSGRPLRLDEVFEVVD